MPEGRLVLITKDGTILAAEGIIDNWTLTSPSCHGRRFGVPPSLEVKIYGDIAYTHMDDVEDFFKGKKSAKDLKPKQIEGR
jgi:hypothetical protein